MGDIVWLASYPKSGSTWLRLLLTSYLRHDGSLPSLEGLLGSPMAASRRLFDREVGIRASEVSPELVQELRGRLWAYRSEGSEESLFVKIHDQYDPTLVPHSSTKAVVYIVRNPLDIVASYSHHFRVSVKEAAARLVSDSHAIGGRERYLVQRIGDWSHHVNSWRCLSPLPTVIARYEDLCDHPDDTLTTILEFLGISAEPNMVARAVDSCHFDRAQRLEKKQGFRENDGASQGFFRRGRPNGWREELTPELVSMIAKVHGPFMAQLGYSLPD